MSDKHVSDPLAEWKVAVEDRFELVTSPEGQCAKLRALANLAYQRYQVDAGELSDMLEISDAAMEWGLLELEEGYRLGLFVRPECDREAGTQYFDGSKLVRVL